MFSLAAIKTTTETETINFPKFHSFQRMGHSFSPLKASQSNPSPTFTWCFQNDFTRVLFCLSLCHKQIHVKYSYLLIHWLLLLTCRRAQTNLSLSEVNAMKILARFEPLLLCNSNLEMLITPCILSSPQVAMHH